MGRAYVVKKLPTKVYLLGRCSDCDINVGISLEGVLDIEDLKKKIITLPCLGCDKLSKVEMVSQEIYNDAMEDDPE